MIGDGDTETALSISASASDECQELPLVDDLEEKKKYGSDADFIIEDEKVSPSPDTSISCLNVSESEMTVKNSSAESTNMKNEGNVRDISQTDDDSDSTAPLETFQTEQLTTLEVPLHSIPSTMLIVPHRGSLRRILDPSSLSSSRDASLDLVLHSHPPTSTWPLYIIDVAAEKENHSRHDSSYQIIFDRQQYEFCTRLFAVLDTDSTSFVGHERVREFVLMHFPVVRRRDAAVFAKCGPECEEYYNTNTSPTFDEIWDRTIHSDLRLQCTHAPSQAIYQIGIEGWMVFSRILALAHDQEIQRRFASRHLQQMMRHKHGGGSGTRTNEVVVVVENPPPGPPALISIRSLIEAEANRMKGHNEECIQGWPFCPLPSPELDLDHYLGKNLSLLYMKCEHRGRVSIEQFSSAQEGDFIVRLHKPGSTSVVRRSFADFRWLNEILEFHKRPGQGHLCGRILPPLLSGGFLQQHSSTIRDIVPPKSDITEKAIGVAKSGINFISSITKSVLSSLVTPSTPSSSPSSSLSRATLGKKSAGTSKDAVQQIERYINYLLENDVFSSSFPLNALLKASQSGLEAAKQVLRDHTKYSKRNRSETIAVNTGDRPYSATSIFSAIIRKTSTSVLRIQGDDDTRWLRAAAQMAMTLQFHGILETTGNESASAKIQHASLPKFDHLRAESWDDEEILYSKQPPTDCNSPKNETNFEVGVINVESELADEEQDSGGYDLLPSPGPTVENRVLNAGVANDRVSGKSSTVLFSYDSIPSEQYIGTHDKKDAVVGSVKVESDIEKLRNIISSTKKTLDKLHKSSAVIESAQSSKNAIQLCIIRDVDSWADNGSEVITQRALVSGVAALETGKNDADVINKALTDDLAWQSLLAASAVKAILEVRDAVSSSLTASRAKSAAYVAAEKSKMVYEACDSTLPMEKVRHFQVEASTAQSHAIHATVVEYEANVAKKRSAISFAHDVKSWNKHRKSELLRTCIQTAKSQRDHYRRAAEVWEKIRDGLVDFTESANAIDDVELTLNPMIISPKVPSSSNMDKQEMLELDVQANLIVQGVDEVNRSSSDDGEIVQSSSHDGVLEEQETHSVCGADAFDVALSFFDSLKESEHSDFEDNVYCLSPARFSHLNENYFSNHQGILSRSNSDIDGTEGGMEQSVASSDYEPLHQSHNNFASLSPSRDPMSTSMESLIDGLITAWGDDNENVTSNDCEERVEDDNHALVG